MNSRPIGELTILTLDLLPRNAAMMPQRSPVNFWLLLAATISVDAVATVWMFESGFNEISATLVAALAYAQLSILCVWVVLSRPQMRIAWIAPFAAGAFIAFLMLVAETTSRGIDWGKLSVFVVLMWAHVALVLPLLWILKPTWLSAAIAEPAAGRRWQFSTWHLLVLMTCLAVLSAIIRWSELLSDANDLLMVGSLIACNAVLLVAALATMSLKRHWLIRLALLLAAAIFMGIVCEPTGLGIARGLDSIVYNLIQAFVVWLWLEHMRRPFGAFAAETNSANG